MVETGHYEACVAVEEMFHTHKHIRSIIGRVRLEVLKHNYLSQNC